LLKNFFFNESEKRLRAAWRLGLQILIMLAISLPLSLLVGLLAIELGDLPGGRLSFRALAWLAASNLTYTAVLFFVKCLGVLGSLVLAARYLDKRPFSGLGFQIDKSWWRDFVFGLLLGAFLMSAVFLIELAAGWVEVSDSFRASGGSFWSMLFFALAAFVCVGFYEEMLSRGYQIRNLAEGLNMPKIGPRLALGLAWIVTSILFGFGHSLNPHASLISSLGVAAAGILLGLPYILTGQLAISIGLHISWNFFQGNVFGFPVSGRDFEVSFIAIKQSGPEAWTGGAFGPEAGLLSLGACLAGCLLIVLWVKWLHKKCSLDTELTSYTKKSP